jgi:hypothetical protein
LCTTSGPNGTDPGSANAAAVSFNTDAECPVAPQCALANGNDASVFTGGGSKDFADIQSSWLYKDGSTPAKDDLQHAYAARYSVTPDSTPPTLCPAGSNATCELLYFGADRIDASGDSQIGFWFYQNRIELTPTPSNGGFKFSGFHKDGDILVLSDFTQGGGTPNVKVYEWNFDPTPGTNPADDGDLPGGGNGTCKTVGGNKVCDDLIVLGGSSSSPADCIGPPTVGAADAFCATVNNVTKTSPWPFSDKSGSSSFLPGEFYEGGINLSLLPAGLASECFSSFSAEQRASADADSVLKDFVLGNFGNCTAQISTQVSSTSVNPGTAVHDTATIVGNKPNITPTSPPNVEFFLCSFAADTTDLCDGGDAAHTGTSIGSSALSGSGGTATADSPDVNDPTSLAPGRYCFRAEWAGDSNYPDDLVEYGQDPGAVECFVVLQSPTTTQTEPRRASNGTAITTPVAVNAHVVDYALVTGATGFGTPTGAVNFFICNPTQVTGAAGAETCAAGTGTPLSGNPRTVTAVANSSPPQSEATSSPFVVANVVGVWCFRAEYVSDTANYTDSSDANHTECFKVRDTSTTRTAQNWLPNDSAHVASVGGTAISGTVRFVLYNNGTCDGSVPANILATFANRPLDANGNAKTNNLTTYVAVTPGATISWKATFTSGTPGTVVGSTSTCESSVLTISD